MDKKITAIEAALEQSNKIRLSKFQSNNDNEILLLEAPSEDLSILHQIGLDYSLNIAKREKDNLEGIVALGKIYKSPVYLGEDLKELCNKHNLRLLRTDMFKGQIDTKLASIIRSFITNEDIHIDTQSPESFFLLAPEESFFESSKEMTNCTLFYRSENNRGKALEHDKFVKVYSWGNNYNWRRRFNFLLSNHDKSSDTSYCFGTIGLFLVSLLLLILSFMCRTGLTNLILLSIIWAVRWFHTWAIEDKFSYNESWNETSKKI